jgi:hypothetical protein
MEKCREVGKRIGACFIHLPLSVVSASAVTSDLRGWFGDSIGCVYVHRASLADNINLQTLSRSVQMAHGASFQ